MAIDPYIASGGTPIGQGMSQTLMQIEQMRRGRRQDDLAEKRNAMIQAAEDRQARREARADHQANTDRVTARYEKEKGHQLAKTKWAMEQPHPADFLRNDPEASEALTKSGVDISKWTDEQAKAYLEHARASISGELGQGPPDKITTQKLDNGGTAVMAGEKLQSVHYPETFAPHYVDPTTDERNFNIFKNLDEQGKKDWLAMNPPSRGSQPRPQQDEFTGEWMLPDEGGGFMRKLPVGAPQAGPVVAQPAPAPGPAAPAPAPAMRTASAPPGSAARSRAMSRKQPQQGSAADTVSQARAAIAAGADANRVAERLKALGIDPAQL